jgi:hypothetical protein
MGDTMLAADFIKLRHEFLANFSIVGGGKWVGDVLNAQTPAAERFHFEKLRAFLSFCATLAAQFTASLICISRFLHIKRCLSYFKEFARFPESSSCNTRALKFIKLHFVLAILGNFIRGKSCAEAELGKFHVQQNHEPNKRLKRKTLKAQFSRIEQTEP